MSKCRFFFAPRCRRFKFRWTLLVGLLLSILYTHAQVYPIQVSTQLTPPFTPYLSDYTSPGSQRLMVQLISNDLSINNYQCRFRITIDGVGITIRTKQNFVPQPTTFFGGAPQILYGEDLLEYFNPNNLDFSGLSRAEFSKTGKLPEGVYRFTVEVLDFNRGTVVSNKGITLAWIVLNDPPLLNLPRNGNKLQILDPTNIPFTWTPRHTGSPNAAFSTEYIYRLVEIWPADRNPYDAFLSQPALHEITTTQSQIIYGLAEPALIPGRKYAWQVQARDTEGRDLFKNQGRSEVYVFQFGDIMGIPQNLRQQSTNSSVIGLRWEPDQAGEFPEQYRIQYRPVGSETWYEQVTDKLWHSIGSLQPDKGYEIRIRSEKGSRHSEYSTAVRINTTADDPIDGFQCGTDPEIVPTTGNISIPQLKPGDTFRASDFRILVTQVTSSTNGLYTGRGLMSVKYFRAANIIVTFSGTINDKYELTTGEVESVYDPNSEWSGVVDEMYKIEGKPRTEANQTQSDSTGLPVTYTILGTIDTIYVNDEGKIVLIDTEGHEEVVEPKKDETTGEIQTTVIGDADGNVYEVDKEGNIVQPPYDVAPEVLSPSSPNQIDSTQLDDFGKLLLSVIQERLDGNDKLIDGLRSEFEKQKKEMIDGLKKEGYETFLYTGLDDQYAVEGMSKKLKIPAEDKVQIAKGFDLSMYNMYQCDVLVSKLREDNGLLIKLLEPTEFMELKEMIQSRIKETDYANLNEDSQRRFLTDELQIELNATNQN